MSAAFDDAAGFDDQNLIGAADGGEAMRDDERGAAAHQVREAFLDHGFGFGIEAGGGFVENQDARIGEDGAGDGDALALAAGKFHAALADDGVVLRSKDSANSSTRAMRQAAMMSSSLASGREKATLSRMVPSKRNVSCSTTPSCVR